MEKVLGTYKIIGLILLMLMLFGCSAQMRQVAKMNETELRSADANQLAMAYADKSYRNDQIHNELRRRKIFSEQDLQWIAESKIIPGMSEKAFNVLLRLDSPLNFTRNPKKAITVPTGLGAKYRSLLKVTLYGGRVIKTEQRVGAPIIKGFDKKKEQLLTEEEMKLVEEGKIVLGMRDFVAINGIIANPPRPKEIVTLTGAYDFYRYERHKYLLCKDGLVIVDGTKGDVVKKFEALNPGFYMSGMF